MRTHKALRGETQGGDLESELHPRTESTVPEKASLFAQIWGPIAFGAFVLVFSSVFPCETL